MRFLSTGLAALAATLATANASASYRAHEWGTFTSLVGSNGITQHGLYHEDEALPDFVHGFGVTQPAAELGAAPMAAAPRPSPQDPSPRDCPFKVCFAEDFFVDNIVTQKMETPVIYFYGAPQAVRVNVKFPEGIITDTFPAPVATSPTRADLKSIGNGDTTFAVEILPAGTPLQPPVAEADNIYAHARRTSANLIRGGREVEKFIFYRGLGRFQPRFGINSRRGDLTIRTDAASEPAAAFLVHVDGSGHGQLMDLRDRDGRLRERRIEPGEITRLSDHSRPLVGEGDSVRMGSAARNTLIRALVEAGLFKDEATAMIDTWEHGYLKVPGLRLLYILPRAEVDEVLPLSFQPAPSRLERVFVGRIEVLLDTEEERVLEQVLRERQAFHVAGLGRFAEAILRRVGEVYRERAADPADLKLIQELIQQAAQMGN